MEIFSVLNQINSFHTAASFTGIQSNIILPHGCTFFRMISTLQLLFNYNTLRMSDLCHWHPVSIRPQFVNFIRRTHFYDRSAGKTPVSHNSFPMLVLLYYMFRLKHSAIIR